MRSRCKTLPEYTKLSYPYLKRFEALGSDQADYVVLFIEKNVGVCVHIFVKGRHYSPVLGEYSTSWDEDLFQPFYGTIELFN